MNVLFADLFWSAANCSHLQHKAINKHTDWNARHFRGVKTFYPDLDMGPENYDKEELLSVIEQADVIEFCSAEHQRQAEAETRIQQNFPGFTFGFDWGEVTKGKCRIYHDYNSFPGYWGDRAKDKSVWSRRKDCGYEAIFSSIPQCIYVYEDCIYIPDVVDEQSPEYTPPEDRQFEKVLLGHYPTGGGNNKNTTELLAAIKQVPVESYIPQKTLFHDEILKSKRRINLSFDALWRGFHGMTTVENVALGIPTMCNIEDEFFPAFEECFGRDSGHPFIRVETVQDIVKALIAYRDYPEVLKAASRSVRRFAEDHWSFKNVANRIIKTYEGLV